MKKIFKYALVSFLITGISTSIKSQPTAPPVMPDQHGSSGNYSTTGAPVGDGTEVMIILGMVYLIRRMKAGEKRSGTGNEPVEF